MTSYDLIPYPTLPKVFVHPAHLATLARLFGMQPAPPDRCRVLDIGCAAGDDIIPMAVALPGSTFVGIDAAAAQIAAGQQLIDHLHIQNIVLHAADFRALPEHLGEFDYIIVYGVYSWVEPEVAEQLLAICQRHLAPQGVAFISYNTLPGWHMRRMSRDMLRYHISNIADPHERAAAAHDLLRFLATHTTFDPDRLAEYDAFGLLVRAEQQLNSSFSDAYILHDLLEESNHPVSFTEFMQRAERHDLQFLAEAQFAMMNPATLPAPLAEQANLHSSNILELEQYIDFFRCRMFRQTLLCHADVALQRALTPDQMQAFFFASAVRPADEPVDLNAEQPVRFRGPSGTLATIGNRVASAALLHLSTIWPLTASFDALLAVACAHLGLLPTDEERAGYAEALGEALLYCYSYDMVELHSLPTSFVTEPGECPQADPLARLQATRGHDVTNRRQSNVRLDDPLYREVLTLLDGTHTRMELEQLVAARIAEERARLAPGETASQALERTLAFLAGNALLVQ